MSQLVIKNARSSKTRGESLLTIGKSFNFITQSLKTKFIDSFESDLDSNSLDVYINYGDSRRIIELASGMEKMMASLAIRVALINVSSLPKTSMLIIDEGFGALDETNLESCGKLLQSLKKWFKNILVISHIDAIKDIVDNNIDIVKKGQDSYVYQP